jgi:hypothetical protein
LPLHYVHVVAHSAALHVQAFSAVHAYQLKIAVRSARNPSLIRATVPGKLLHVRAIPTAVAGHIQNQSAIYVSNGELAVSQINKFPPLVPSPVARILLHICVLVRAAPENIDAFLRVDVPDQPTVSRLPLKLYLCKCGGRSEQCEDNSK